jgi:hypothetical protein
MQSILSAIMQLKTEKTINERWSEEISLRKASSVGNFYTIKNKFRENYYRMFEQGK